MEGLDMDTTPETVTDVKTFRGRSLEEVLPQIRAELGADAIVVRRREGLAGGVAGFFQRSFVEVEARAAHEDEEPLGARNDRATAEGFASPAIQALVEQASPFADALARAAVGLLQDPEGRRELGRRAHAYVVRNHSPGSYVARLERVLADARTARTGVAPPLASTTASAAGDVRERLVR
jgi:flagellar biosynthesis GTPase FlhF